MRRIKEILRCQPDNEWLVYEACKCMANLLLPLSHSERVALLRKKLPEANHWAIARGLAEFESVPAHHWDCAENAQCKMSP